LCSRKKRERGGTNFFIEVCFAKKFVPPSPEPQSRKQQPCALNEETKAGEGGQGDEGQLRLRQIHRINPLLHPPNQFNIVQIDFSFIELLYFRGWRLVREYLEGGGDLKELYKGKVNLHDIELVRGVEELIDPVYVPKT